MIVPLIGLSLLFAAGVPWMLLIARRASFAFAIGSVVASASAGALATMWLTALLSLPLLATVIAVWSVVGVAGVVVCVRKRAGLRLPTNLRPGLAATAGALIWFAVIGVAQVVPGAARLSWAMQGDSANNVLFSRQIILDGGIRLGAGENPVPLPAGPPAIAMEFGRSSVDSADLLRHDVTAFAALWALLIGVSAVMAGLLAGRVASAAGARSLVVGLSAAFGSAVPLAWLLPATRASSGSSTHTSPSSCSSRPSWCRWNRLGRRRRWRS